MRYKKIITFYIKYDNKHRADKFIRQLKGFAHGNATMYTSGIDISNITIEQGFNDSEE